MRCWDALTGVSANDQQQLISRACIIRHTRASKALSRVPLKGHRLHTKCQGLLTSEKRCTELRDAESESPGSQGEALSSNQEVPPLLLFRRQRPAVRGCSRVPAALQAALEAGITVDAYSVCPQPPPAPPAEFGWLFALAVLCASRLSRAQTRADQFRPDLALVPHTLVQ